MRVLISGSSGLVGRAVIDRLASEHHDIVPLQRTPSRDSGEAVWEPIRSGTWDRSVGPVDAVVHLAGEPIANRRWSPAQKQRIYDSRVVGTRQLCEQLARLEDRPEVLISASAIGYYGDRDDETLAETSPPGRDFLADVCTDWEAATAPAVDSEIRVVNLRIGLVLARHGGALARMLPIFRLGFGGRLGRGQQYMSWISLSDLTRIIIESISNSALTGAVNAVAPNPVTNRQFTQSLGQHLNRPAWFAVPAPILRILAGEMADQMLLSSIRVEPKKLVESGFTFDHPDLDAALDDL